MKKSIKCGITAAVVAVAGFAAYQSSGSYGVQNNSLMMQNIEALAQTTDEQGESGIKCKHSYEAPDQILNTGETLTANVVCYKKGSVYVKDSNATDSLAIDGDYEKYKSYTVVYYHRNCLRATGSCCDQRKVGVFKAK